MDAFPSERTRRAQLSAIVLRQLAEETPDKALAVRLERAAADLLTQISHAAARGRRLEDAIAAAARRVEERIR